MSEPSPEAMPDNEPPVDPEELHASSDLDREDLESAPQDRPVPRDADERLIAEEEELAGEPPD